MSDLWQPLSLSLRIASVATLLASLVAIPLAFLMARTRMRGTALLESLFTLPLVLPPTVVGYLIIQFLGLHGWIGHWVYRWWGYSMIFRIEGAILAGALVALPLLYMPAKAAFAEVEPEQEDLARIFGASNIQLFWHVSLPMARRGILSGVLLGFARALGEFGATVMVFGWQPGKLTLPIAIYADYEHNELSHAGGAVILLLALSFALIVLYNRSLRRRG